MQSNTEFPRVELPNLTAEDKENIKALHAEMDWYTRTKTTFLSVLIAKGRPFLGVRKPAPKPTANVRHIASVRTRSDYLRSVGRSSAPQHEKAVA